MSNYTDKLIPYLEKDFHNKLIYSIFIKEKKENFINKIVALIFIVLIIIYSFINQDYKIIPLNEIQIRVNEMFLNESMIIKNDKD
ncbi:MAG: hypothetical protein KatS3mg068_1131 [Candidatus Sericytochromatia bacterium]|nr:MAG: hypothetical protein KatS3mg068_1131 [Candidatus Sericytochromatia bacterium]